MRRAERKLQLSHNVVGEDVMHEEEKEKTRVEMGDLKSVIFGLHMFDPKEINNEESDGLKLSELNNMAEMVIAMRHEKIPVEAGQKLEVSPVDLLDGSDLGQGTSASVLFDPGLDEASYLSWVEQFKQASQISINSVLDLGGRRKIPEDKNLKFEAARKKVEEKKLAKWEAYGYHSLSVEDPICPADGDTMSQLGSVQFVYGDCTDPSKICPSEPAVIFRLFLFLVLFLQLEWSNCNFKYHV